jgi:hypothetical protein
MRTERAFVQRTHTAILRRTSSATNNSAMQARCAPLLTTHTLREGERNSRDSRAELCASPSGHLCHTEKRREGRTSPAEEIRETERETTTTTNQNQALSEKFLTERLFIAIERQDNIWRRPMRGALCRAIDPLGGGTCLC